MVSRIYVEKKPGFDVEAHQLLHELRTILGIEGLTGIRLINRYDVEGATNCSSNAFPPFSASRSPTMHLPNCPPQKARLFLPSNPCQGQFDQRAPPLQASAFSSSPRANVPRS